MSDCENDARRAALHDLARALAAEGRIREAEALDRAATADASASEPDLAAKKALIALFLAGRLAETAAMAETFCRRAPQDAFGWKVLGAARQRLGDLPAALAACRAAAALAPQDAEARFNLGAALQAAGRAAEAEACYRAVLARDPNLSAARQNLVNILLATGRCAAAEPLLRRLAAERPDDASTQCALGAVLRNLGRASEAADVFRRAAELAPDLAAAQAGLGGCLAELGRPAEAETHLRRAADLAPNAPDVRTDLGRVLDALGRPHAAEDCLRRALALAPRDAKAWSNLGALLRTQNRLAEAAVSCRRAVALDPNLACGHNNLGAALQESGRFADALASFRRALDCDPENLSTRSNLLYLLNYSTEFSPELRREEARTYGDVAARSARPFTAWTCATRPDRLRVGLVSGDLRNHAVGHFLESVLAALDPDRIELAAYPTNARADDLTARIRPRFALWRPICGLSDHEAASAIRADGVHVLLDLSGHTAGNRLPVFARRPAPAQASWLGYAATTGLAAMDCVLGDPVTLPDACAAQFTETLVRLPETRLCFTPPADAPDVAPPPARATGRVTFGCCNDLAKVNDAVAALWSRILAAVPGSRLLLKAGQLADPDARRRAAQRFARLGLSGERLILEGPEPRAAYLRAYGRMDIALDPFPYPGGATTAEGLWMGAPCLTLNGANFLARQGAGLMTNAGLADWIAADPHEYLRKAAAFAADLPALADLRARLRERLRASPLCDAAAFARSLEAELWEIWRRWGAARVG